jgi:hypothetical protein
MKMYDSYYLQSEKILNIFPGIQNQEGLSTMEFFFSYGSTAQVWALAASMKLSVSLQLLDLGQSAGLLGQVIGHRKASVNCPG